MFDLVQVQQYGVSRKAIRAIPPRWVTHDGTKSTVTYGYRLVTPVIIPDDCQVAPLGWLRTVIHPAAMFSAGGKLNLNPDQPWLIAETVVHELVHYHQRARKGPVVYALDYVNHLPGAVFDALRFGGTWHDHHEMEREARRIAQEIIDAHFYIGGYYRIEQETVPIDAVFEIQKRLTRKAA